MIIKTDKVHEKGVSIGMFSRQGVATGSLNSHFRDKSFKISPQIINKPENKLKSSTEFNDDALDVRKRSSLTQSYFFRCVSREKDPRRQVPQGADNGLYKPNFDIIFSKAVTLPLNQTGSSMFKKGRGFSFDMKNLPVCDFRIRDLKRKIARKTKELTPVKLDLQTLYNRKLIEKEVYLRLIDPELGIAITKQETTIKDSSPPKNDALDDDELRKQQDYVANAYNKAKELDSLKAELEEIVVRNVEKLRLKEDEVVERPKKHVNSPLPLHQQIVRSPLIRKDKIRDYEDLNVSKSSIESNSHKAHKFSSYVERNLYKNLQDKELPSYDVPITVLDLIRPRSKNGAEVRIDKQKQRDYKHEKHYILSTCDYSDINETSLAISPKKKDRSFVNMDRSLGRAEHHASRLERTPKQHHVPQDKSFSVSFYSAGNRTLNTSLRAALRSASVRHEQASKSYAKALIADL